MSLAERGRCPLRIDGAAPFCDSFRRGALARRRGAQPEPISDGQAKDGGKRRWKFWPMRPWRAMLPARIGRWSLTSLRRLVKTGRWPFDKADYWSLLAENHLTRGKLPHAAEI